MPDIFSSMLKDTTSKHRTHLFDLNCKICTGKCNKLKMFCCNNLLKSTKPNHFMNAPLGQKSEDDYPAKRMKPSKKPEPRSPRQEFHSSRSLDGQPQVTTYQHQDPLAYQPTLTPANPANMDPAALDSVPQANQDLSILPPPAPITSTVSSITNTRRDPRMARHGAGVTVTYTPPEKPTNSMVDPLVAAAAVPAPAELGPKVPLPMPPAPPTSVLMSTPAKARCTSRHHSFNTLPDVIDIYDWSTKYIQCYEMHCNMIFLFFF